MFNRVHRLLIFAALTVALAALCPGALSAQGFSSSRVARAEPFVSFDKVPPGSSFRLAVALRIEPGWHVNAHKPSLDYLIPTSLEIAAPAESEGIRLRAPIYPDFVERSFSFSEGKPLRVYEDRALIGVEGTAVKGLAPSVLVLRATLTTQACNDNSCLAPAKLPVVFEIPIAGPSDPVNAIHADIFGAIKFPGGSAYPSQSPGAAEGGSLSGLASPGGGAGPDNTVGRWVADLGWAATLALIFTGGLALNLTPCVYPLIPITLAYFGGQAAGRPSRTFTLASIYVLGMCVTYSALGVLAATTGKILGSALQSPLALGFVALVLVALALSMLGLYDLQVPGWLRSRIGSRPGYGGALFMGLTVGLVAAPCVGPFVVSLLAFVGETGSPLVGFWLFFVLALGLGLPYLLLGGFAGTVTGLPRAGAWMVWVKKVYGCLLLAMALYFINPLLPNTVSRLTIPVTLLASGLYLGFIEGSPIRSAGFRAARYATAIACAAIAAALLVPTNVAAGVSWEEFSDEAFAAARSAGKPVIIDFTAEWCLPCKELDHRTFTGSKVVEASKRFVTLKADITGAPAAPVAALLAKHGIAGAPTIVFIDASGEERLDLRLTGFEDAESFLERMKKAR